jgi:RNA polymerase sigma-70 factor (ECF subfamily)
MDEKNINKEILVAASQGNLKAFDALISFYQKAIFNHVYRLVNNTDDAGDLVQDTFVKLFKTRERIDSEANFRSYLYKIATNTAFDWLKKKKSQKEDLIIDDENVNFETIEADQSYYKLEELDRVGLEIALDKIKPKYKNLLLLYYKQGFSYDEIAEIMNQPLNTIKTGLFRAKKELLEKFN